MIRSFFVGFFGVVSFAAGCVAGPDSREDAGKKRQPVPTIERLAGDTDVAPPSDVLDQGKVLISYSDCATCHKENDRKRGPAFRDIAARYPMNSTYIDILAKRIIRGAKGAWGNVVMAPHPGISEEDAQAMVMYILSLHANTAH